MRLRKLSLRYDTIDANISMMNTNNECRSTLALIGGNGSGKSLCAHFASLCYASLVARGDERKRLFERRAYLGDAHGCCEFESAGKIMSVQVRASKIEEHDFEIECAVGFGAVRGGFLCYGALNCCDHMRTSVADIGLLHCRLILKDLYIGSVKDSIIWIDDLDLGLDLANSRELLRLAMRKASEHDCQLIVSTCNLSVVGGVRIEDHRHLANREGKLCVNLVMDEVEAMRARK